MTRPAPAPHGAAAGAEAAGIPAPLTRLLEEMEGLDRTARMEELVEYADRYVEVAPEVATPPYPELNRAPHCESQAFVFAVDRPDGTLQFHFAVESEQGLSARAWAAILDETCSGQPLEQVARLTDDAITRLFGKELSMGKGQGLVGMLELVVRAARERLAARGRARADAGA